MPLYNKAETQHPLRADKDTAGTHSFGFGLVGSGGASLPGDGDSFGVGVESGTVGLGAEAGRPGTGSGCGRGGGESAVSLGKHTGNGGGGD